MGFFRTQIEISRLEIHAINLPKMVLTVYGEAVRLSAREMGKYGKHAVIY